MTKIRYGTLAGLLIAGFSVAQADDRYEGDSHDAWVAGKVETVLLLNRHLNSFAIDTDVDGGVVTLTGAVESDIDRDLAGSLAEGVEGVESVENELRVEGETARAANARNDAVGDDDDRPFGQWVDDATTTAAVKSKLIADDATKGLEIDVDTRDDVVTLSGRVQSQQESEVATQLAMETGDVESVRNNLVVDPE